MRDDAIANDFLTDLGLPAKGFDEAPIGSAAPILADGEIEADLVLGKVAGADLDGVDAGLDRQPTLQAITVVERQGEARLIVDDATAGDFKQAFQAGSDPSAGQRARRDRPRS